MYPHNNGSNGYNPHANNHSNNGQWHPQYQQQPGPPQQYQSYNGRLSAQPYPSNPTRYTAPHQTMVNPNAVSQHYPSQNYQQSYHQPAQQVQQPNYHINRQFHPSHSMQQTFQQQQAPMKMHNQYSPQYNQQYSNRMTPNPKPSPRFSRPNSSQSNNRYNSSNAINTSNRFSPRSRSRSRERQDNGLSELFTETQSHEEFLAFYTKSRKEHEVKEDEEIAIKSEVHHSMRFNFCLLPILNQLDPYYRRGARIGLRDYGISRKLGSDALFSEKPRPYDKLYGVDYPVPEKKPKIKQQATATTIITELMQREQKRAKDMFKYGTSEGNMQCTFKYEGSIIGYGMGSTKVEARKQCAESVLATFQTEPVMKQKFGKMIMQKQFGLKVKKKKKDKGDLRKGRWSAVAVTLKLTHKGHRSRCRYEYQPRLQEMYKQEEVDVAVDEMYLERWNEFDGRGHHVPSHCHALLTEDGWKMTEVEVMTSVRIIKDEQKLKVKEEVKVKEEMDVDPVISMPLPHSQLKMKQEL